MILRQTFTILTVIGSILTPFVLAEDVFCGQLMIHKQQWLARGASTISSQTTVDLKECINICCSIPNCNAVTYMGFISNTSQEVPSVNCLMFSCEEKCVIVDRPSAAEGVISVVINKTSTETRVTAEAPGTPSNAPDTREGIFLPSSSNEVESSTAAPGRISITFPRPPEMLDGNIATQSMPSKSLNNHRSDMGTVTSSQRTNSSTVTFLSQYTPIWAVGIAIVVAFVCIGVNVVLISAFCCYRQHKNRMRSETFTPHLKAPTLHAFNPSA